MEKNKDNFLEALMNCDGYILITQKGDNITIEQKIDGYKALGILQCAVDFNKQKCVGQWTPKEKKNEKLT
jgi:hypothetical protein